MKNVHVGKWGMGKVRSQGSKQRDKGTQPANQINLTLASVSTGGDLIDSLLCIHPDFLLSVLTSHPPLI